MTDEAAEELRKIRKLLEEQNLVARKEKYARLKRERKLPWGTHSYADWNGLSSDEDDELWKNGK